jgi:uncharacterized phiE125 gp8 family phage protein
LRYSVVTSPDVNDPVVTTAEMRSFLRIDDTEEDAVINALVAGAVTALDGREGLLRRAIVTQVWKLTCYGPGEDLIIPLRLGGITAVSAVTTLINGTATPWTGYRLQEDDRGSYIEPQDTSSWPSYDVREDAFSITFTAGYGAASAVPEAVKHAVKVLAAHRYHNRESAGWPAGFLDALRPFRFMRM